MTRPSNPRPLALGDLIGRSLSSLRVRLGGATVERRVGGDLWVVYELADARLRVRLTHAGRSPVDSEHVASWTIAFHRSGPRPEEATHSLGLSLEGNLEPTPGDPLLLRCPITDPVSGARHSLTARVRDGRLVELTAFDEPPEWLAERATVDR